MALRLDEGPLKIGARFLERYEIQGLLGHGGQAWVYRAQHTFTGREVAIKIIHSPYGVTDEMLVRAKAEARALGKLDHDNIVIMHDAGVTDEGQIYILMELLRGCSFRRVLAEHGQLEVEETLRLFIQAGKAVQAAHAVRMIHRDLKPDNLFVLHGNGPVSRLKVLDFGVAKMLDEIGFTTRKDIVVGTVLYMSPEQAKGLPVTEQSDIYALGLIMFEALIGKHPCVLMFEQELLERGEPYRRPGIADIPPIQVNKIPPLLTELRRDIPLYVAHLVQRAIAKVAQQRFATMANFVAAMESCLERYLREVPLSERRPSGRDLSAPAPKPSELPVSQRATAKQSVPPASPSSAHPSAPTAEQPALPISLVNTEVMKPVVPARERDASPGSDAPVGFQTSRIGTNLVSSQSEVPPKPEPASVVPKPEAQRQRTSSKPAPLAPMIAAAQTAPKQKPPASGPFKPGTPPPVTVGHPNAGSEVARANRAIARNALILGGLFGAALSTAAMLHFGPASPAASQPVSASSGAILVPVPSDRPTAAPLPAVPEGERAAEPQEVGALDVPSPGPGAASPPVAPTLATPSATPIARAKPTARATASTKPVDKMDQRLLQLESDLDGARPKSPKPAASTTQNKSWVQPAEERKKAIYGD